MMAEHTPHPPLPHHDKGDVTLCQPLPLHLPSPRIRIARGGMGMGRRQEITSPPIPIEFVDVAAGLPPSSLCPPTCPPTSLPPEDTGVRARCSVGSVGVPGGEGQQRGGIQIQEEVPPTPQQVLGGQGGGTLVLGGDDMARCVVLDLQGNVVVQETPTTRSPAPPLSPYLVEQPILVQVGAGEATHTKGGVRKEGGEGGARPGKKVKFESRWSFREVEVKESSHIHIHHPPPMDEEVEESEGEEASRPRRKSAKRARQRWKSISEVEGGRGGAVRGRRTHPALPRSKTQLKGEVSLREEWIVCIMIMMIIIIMIITPFRSYSSLLSFSPLLSYPPILCSYSSPIFLSYPSLLSFSHIFLSSPSLSFFTIFLSYPSLLSFPILSLLSSYPSLQSFSSILSFPPILPSYPSLLPFSPILLSNPSLLSFPILLFSSITSHP